MTRYRSCRVFPVLALLFSVFGCGDEGNSGGNGGSSGTAGVAYCPPTTDVDADGFDKPACGGNDCDDREPWLYPGSPMGFEITEVARFPQAEESADLPEERDVAAALAANGDIVIAFEGADGLWFGRYASGVWQVESVVPLVSPALAEPSLVVRENGEIVIGFAQVDEQWVPMLARGDGASFDWEAVADQGGPPVLALAPDQTLWMALEVFDDDSPAVFEMGPEQNGEFALSEVEDLFAPPGTRYQIDPAGHHHLLWGESASRTPPVKFWHATDASGTFTATEFDGQCFHDRGALLLDASDVHVAYVRPRNAEGVYYMGPLDEAPSLEISDARGAFSDRPEDSGVALATYEGAIRLAYVTDENIILASQLTAQFSSTLVEDNSVSSSFGSPALVAAPDGLHLLYFATSGDDLVLKHARLPAGAPVGCSE